MYGLDYLGGAKYVDVILREHPNGWAAGTFANTFGDASRWVPRLLETGRCPRFRVHAVWEDSHTYDSRKHDKIIVSEIRKWNAIKAKFLNVDIQFSPFCEHRMNRAQIARLIDICMMETAGVLKLVNAAEKGARLNRGDVIEEYHGSFQEGLTGHNHSFDGLNQVDADIVKSNRVHVNANTQYFWHPRMNGRWNTKDVTPRPQRKGWADSKIIDSLIYQAQGKGNVSLPARWLLKSHAENHGPKNGVPDAKGDKCMIICPVKASSVDLVAANGQVVERLSYLGTYDTKPKEPVQRYRYYSDEWGYQIADKAKRIQGGNPVVSVRVGGRIYGTVNPAFRENEYRNKN